MVNALELFPVLFFDMIGKRFFESFASKIDFPRLLFSATNDQLWFFLQFLIRKVAALL